MLHSFIKVGEQNSRKPVLAKFFKENKYSCTLGTPYNYVQIRIQLSAGCCGENRPRFFDVNYDARTVKLTEICELFANILQFL